MGRGRRWEPADADPVPLLIGEAKNPETGETKPIGLAPDFIAAHRGRFGDETLRHYDRALRRFGEHLRTETGARRITVDLLTRDALERWWGVLTQDLGLAIATARLQIGAVTACWAWGYDSDRYGETVPRPKRIRMPSPVRSPARAPTWEQMDAVISAAQAAEAASTGREEAAWAWRVQLLMVLRCTGLRQSQAMALRWEDVDLDGGVMLIAGSSGKSQRERAGRWVPIAPVLARAMAGWGRREGFLIAPDMKWRRSVAAWIRGLWEAAEVPSTVWDAGRDRAIGSPQHAFRRGFKTGLVGLGVDSSVRDFLVGHHRGVNETYEDLHDLAREAVALVPEFTRRRVVVDLDRLRAEG